LIAKYVASAATPVSGQPIAMRAAASQPVRSMSYNWCWTRNRAANTATQVKVAMSKAVTARRTDRQR
jgi:hypothetical protein